METTKDAIILLREYQPDNCKDWIDGVGDCKKISCDFCRIEHCMDVLEEIKP